MHRELARQNGVVAAAELDEHAELVRGRVRVRGDEPAVDGLEARATDDDDVLAELGHQLDALVLELLLEAFDALLVGNIEHRLGERLELVVLRDGLRLAADSDHGANSSAIGTR